MKNINKIIETIKNEGLTLMELDELLMTFDKELIKSNELLEKEENEIIEELEKENIILEYNSKKDTYEFVEKGE